MAYQIPDYIQQENEIEVVSVPLPFVVLCVAALTLCSCPGNQ